MIRRSIIATSCAVLLLVGCGEKKATHEKVVPISGKIIYNGQPVKAADVSFICNEKNRSAFGRTNDKGEFKLTTFSPNDGAVPGKHVVVVTQIQAGPPAKTPDISSTDYVPPGENQSTDPTPPKNTVPAKYGDVKTSDLIAVVTDGANPEMSLELKD